MKAIERLFSCASAHGIDLRQAAGESANLYGAGAPRRRRLMQQLAGIETDEDRGRREKAENREHLMETSKGKQSRVARPKLYSHAELGRALAGWEDTDGVRHDGLEGPVFLAAMYSFALDPAVYDDLYRTLRRTMAELAEREKWPIEIDGAAGDKVHYGDELCKLVLVHDWCQPLFVKIPALYAIFVGVSEDVWRGKLLRRYMDAVERYERWLAIARAYVDRRVYQEFPMDDDSAASTRVASG